MENNLLLLLGSSLCLANVTNAAIVANVATKSDRIVTGGGSGSGDLYASGNDDAFSSYGIMTYSFTPAQFGEATIGDILSVTLNLTFNDRGFSDGTQIEAFFTPDDVSALGGGNYSILAADAAAVNGINISEFATPPVSLGTIDLGFDTTDSLNGGLNFDYTLTFSGATKTALLTEINNSSEFQIIIGAVNAADDVTFSGVANTFDPGDPELTISATSGVPEPSSTVLGALAGLMAFCRRRRA